MKVSRTVATVLARDVPHLHGGDANHAAVAVLSRMASLFDLLCFDALSNFLHHLQLLRVSQISRSRIVSKDVRPDVHAGPIHEPLLNQSCNEESSKIFRDTGSMIL